MAPSRTEKVPRKILSQEQPQNGRKILILEAPGGRQCPWYCKVFQEEAFKKLQTGYTAWSQTVKAASLFIADHTDCNDLIKENNKKRNLCCRAP